MQITDFENESIKDTNILVGKTEVLAVKGKNGDQYNSLLKVVNLDHIDGQNQMNSDSSLNILVQQVEQSCKFIHISYVFRVNFILGITRKNILNDNNYYYF